MSLTVHLALVFHVFITVAIKVMHCGRHDIGPSPLPSTSLCAFNNGAFAWNALPGHLKDNIFSPFHSQTLAIRVIVRLRFAPVVYLLAPLF